MSCTNQVSNVKVIFTSLSVATEACTQKMRKGLEYLQTEKIRIKDKRPNARSKESVSFHE